LKNFAVSPPEGCEVNGGRKKQENEPLFGQCEETPSVGLQVNCGRSWPQHDLHLPHRKRFPRPCEDCENHSTSFTSHNWQKENGACYQDDMLKVRLELNRKTEMLPRVRGLSSLANKKCWVFDLDGIILSITSRLPILGTLTVPMHDFTELRRRISKNPHSEETS
jgi:hypothetical protein